MAPGRCYMSGNTCGCRMSWTYRYTVMVPRMNISDCVLWWQWHLIPSHQLWDRFIAKDDLVPFRCSPISSCTAPPKRRRWWASWAAHVMGAAIPNVLSARRLRMVREDLRAS
ncbi:hypothetical protein TNCV_2993231 [Trichonephila clavipes]|nr:hypothetical protein TNCV_2993231 [Trichonephila clavipes]